MEESERRGPRRRKEAGPQSRRIQLVGGEWARCGKGKPSLEAKMRSRSILAGSRAELSGHQANAGWLVDPFIMHLN